MIRVCSCVCLPHVCACVCAVDIFPSHFHIFWKAYHRLNISTSLLIWVCEIRILSTWNSQFHCTALWYKGVPCITSVVTNRVVSWRNLIPSCVWNIFWNGMQSKSIFRKAIGEVESYLWANGCYYCGSVFSQWHKCQSRDAADGKEMPLVKVS